jgi:hypothetical protein
LFLIPPADFKSYQFFTDARPNKTKNRAGIRHAIAYTGAVKNLVWTCAFRTKQQILNFKIFPLKMGFID